MGCHIPLYHPELMMNIHRSVKERWEADPQYRPRNLVEYLEQEGWPRTFA